MSEIRCVNHLFDSSVNYISEFIRRIGEFIERLVDPRAIGFNPRNNLGVNLIVGIVHQKRILVRNVILHPCQHFGTPVQNAIFLFQETRPRFGHSAHSLSHFDNFADSKKWKSWNTPVYF